MLATTPLALSHVSIPSYLNRLILLSSYKVLARLVLAIDYPYPSKNIPLLRPHSIVVEIFYNKGLGLNKRPYIKIEEGL